MIKELNQKTNEELCNLIVRLKLQLLESRFKMASGELEKTHKIREIRRTIAQAFTVLNSRGIDLTVGTHGITMYDRKNNTVKSINDVVSDSLDAKDETAKSKKSTKTVGQGVAESTVAASKLNKANDSAQATNFAKANANVSNQKLVQKKKTNVETKRKVIGA